MLFNLIQKNPFLSSVVVMKNWAGNESKEEIVKELSEITERLSALQSNSDLLKHIADVLDVSEGEAILLQISQNLHMLRSFVAMPSESMNL